MNWGANNSPFYFIMYKYSFELSYDEIESNYGQYYLLQYLYPELKLGKNHSPLRRDEKPSFLIGKNPNGSIFWKDQRTNQSGNLYTLIILREPSVSNFTQAINFINRQLKRLNIQPINKPKIEKTLEKPRFKLGVVRRDWNNKDLAYWKQFGISKETLELYRVAPISWIYLNPNTPNEQIIKAEELSFVFKECKDNEVTLKVYQPYSLTAKWFSDCTESISAWHGWEQMSKTGEILIWTKSLKDVMSIKETTGFDAVSLQAESWIPKESVVAELKTRFKKVYLLYDNDFNSVENWGRLLGKNIATLFNLTQIEIPTVFQSKDYSQLYTVHKNKSVLILKNLL